MKERTTTDQDRAYWEIRTRIFDGRLQPRQRISHRGLANELDIGQMPVRGALTLLAAEGFVTIVDKSGTFVNEPTPGDLREIFEVRLALETTAAYLAGAQWSDLGDECRRGPVADLRGNRLPRHHDRTKVGWVFHHELFIATRNERLYKTYMALRDQTLALTEIPRHDAATVRRGTKEHIDIFNAIKERDSESARLKMWNHIVDGTPVRINLIRNKNDSNQ